MFLKYLSDHDVEERYWPFIFRFETLAAGVVWEASGKIGSMTDEQAREFFSSVYAGALDENSGLTPPGWWSKVEPPPYGWFCEYIERELDRLGERGYAASDVKELKALKKALEDELDLEEAVKIKTIGEALEMLDMLEVA